MPAWLANLLPIAALLAVVLVVVLRLPRVELGHSAAFRRRRLLNWLPLGLTYAFLYMGRYNLTVSKNALGDLMSKADFGTIFFWGTLVYGCAFVLNGPLTDRLGGRRAMLIGTLGSAAMNLVLGVVTWAMLTGHWPSGFQLVPVFSLVYAANMYFQSFGAVAIVKVNAHWFHVRERGVFSGIFGILISLGIYFAFDWGRLIVDNAPVIDAASGLRAVWWAFVLPAAILVAFFLVDLFVVRDAPSLAGFADFDTGDNSLSEAGERVSVVALAGRMLRNPVILTIAAIEFCSGFLRNAIMHWYIIFANQTGVADSFVPKNWGLLLCCAGIMGGVLAGTISDHVFQSRRGPVAALLYGVMGLAVVALLFTLGSPLAGWVVVAISLCVIGVHGVLSGTASMDFGGRRNVGVAVGLIDGCVYLGTATQALLYGQILPAGEAGKQASNWLPLPIAMLPVALVGLFLAARLWRAAPRRTNQPVQVTPIQVKLPDPTADTQSSRKHSRRASDSVEHRA